MPSRTHGTPFEIHCFKGKKKMTFRLWMSREIWFLLLLSIHIQSSLNRNTTACKCKLADYHYSKWRLHTANKLQTTNNINMHKYDHILSKCYGCLFYKIWLWHISWQASSNLAEGHHNVICTRHPVESPSAVICSV